MIIIVDFLRAESVGGYALCWDGRGGSGLAAEMRWEVGHILLLLSVDGGGSEERKKGRVEEMLKEVCDVRQMQQSKHAQTAASCKRRVNA